jgi:hypothetical protein
VMAGHVVLLSHGNGEGEPADFLASRVFDT